MTHPLEETARATAEARSMLPAGAPVLAMVSGGADSVSLLRLLASGALGQRPLAVLHVDHAIRADSAEDAAFVESLCAELGVECRVVRFDVADYAEREGLNLEDAGRRVRYRFAEEELDALCARVGARSSDGRIAVAHTFDDRLETFLMRLITGSGAGALAGIRHTRGRVVRPLLDARREQVRDYLAALGQAWREDVTNSDTSRLRARIRHDVLPLAFDINPRFDEALTRTLTLLEDEDELLATMAEGFAHTFAEVVPGRVTFERSMMRTLSRAMARRTVRAALAEAFPEASRLDFEHVESLADAARAEDSFARDLPFGLRAHTEYARMVVSRNEGEIPALAPSLLEMPGKVWLGEAGALVAENRDPSLGLPDDPHLALIDADRVEGPLIVDAPREGDRIRPLGMTGTKKLSDLLVDAKVPKRLRPATPVVRDGDAVVWVAGVRLAEDYKVGPDTTHAMLLRWEREGTP